MIIWYRIATLVLRRRRHDQTSEAVRSIRVDVQPHFARQTLLDELLVASDAFEEERWNDATRVLAGVVIHSVDAGLLEYWAREGHKLVELVDLAPNEGEPYESAD